MISLETRIRNFLGSVAFTADRVRQKAVWVDKQKGVSSVISLGELYCQIFDDNDLEGFIDDELDSAELTSKQKALIRHFSEVLRQYPKAPRNASSSISDRDVFYDPEWMKINELADRTLAQFDEPLWESRG